ncbi:MAG: T9SS type A sorting domain-containing protein, partial [Flavobacterium sp.]
NADANFIRNAIFGVYKDTNILHSALDADTTPNNIQNVNYYVLDSGPNAAPNRVFVANFNELPQFGCNATAGLQTSQIIIYETTNIIDVLISKRTPCLSWNSGSGLVGIQNAVGTLTSVPPGRNTGTWSANNEAWRFTPSGASTAQLNWRINGVFMNSADNPWNYCPQENEEVEAVVAYNNCNQTIYISSTLGYPLVATLPDFAEPVDITVCSTENPTQVVDLTPNNIHILNSLNVADYNIRYYLDPTDASNTTNNYIQTPTTFELNASQTIYASIESYETGCVYIKPFQVIVIPFLTSPTGASTQNFTAGQTLADLIVIGTGIVWYTAPIGGTSLPNNTPLSDNNVYFAAQSISGCESRNRLAVTTLLVLNADQFTAKQIHIKPNPVMDEVQIESSVLIEKVQLFSLDGREILSDSNPFKSTTLDLSQLNSGVYFITLSAKTGKVTQKIIKK